MLFEFMLRSVRKAFSAKKETLERRPVPEAEYLKSFEFLAPMFHALSRASFCIESPRDVDVDHGRQDRDRGLRRGRKEPSPAAHCGGLLHDR